MHDKPPSNDRMLRSGNADGVNRKLIMRLAARISLDIAEITGMARRDGWQRVRGTGGVVMIPGARRIGSTAITKLMNMKSMLLMGCESFEISYNLDLAIGGFAELHFSANLVARCRMHDGHGLFDIIPGIPGITGAAGSSCRRRGLFSANAAATRRQPYCHDETTDMHNFTRHKFPSGSNLRRLCETLW